MSANLGLLAVVGLMFSCGVYLLVERSVTRVLLGVLLMGNAVNLLLLTAGGGDGEPVFVRSDGGTDAPGRFADPLAQAMILTAIVITMGLAAFVLALGYRAFTLLTQDRIADDPEDAKVGDRTVADAPDRDRSDDPVTGEPGPGGDAYGPTDLGAKPPDVPRRRAARTPS
ncbi:MAG: Na(+)/H(+) antiporter subunit C [Mycobacteriaceae bacterium]